MIKRILVALSIVSLFTACSSSNDDDNAPPIDPPPDDPVAGPDCMGDIAVDGTTYCVDADTRIVSATGADGTQIWSFTLPDFEHTRKIDALVLLDEQPWVIGSSDTIPACVTSAAYLCTDIYNIGRINPDAAIIPFGEIHLGSGGFPLMTGTSNYLYHLNGSEVLAGRDVFAVGIGTSLFLAVDVYELMPDADRALPDSWQFIGASVTRSDPRFDDTTGGFFAPVRAQRYYPNLHVKSLAGSEAGKLLVTLDSATERLEPTTLIPVATDPQRPLFAGQPYEVVAPLLVTTLRGDQLDALAQRLDLLGTQVRTSATSIEIVQSNAPVPPPDPDQGVDWDITEQIVYTCAGGGSLTLDRMDKMQIGVDAQLREEYRYQNCSVQAPDDDPSLPAGNYRLDGIYISDHYNTFGSGSAERTQHEWQLLMLENPDMLSDTISAETMHEANRPHGGIGSSSRTASISSRVQSQNGEQLLSVTDTQYTESYTTPYQQAPFYAYSGQGSISGITTGGQTVTVTIDPAFSITTVFSNADNTPPDWMLEGQLQASATDGSTMTATAADELHGFIGSSSLEDLATYENGNVDYLVTSGSATLSESKSFNSLQFPISRHDTDQNSADRQTDP